MATRDPRAVRHGEKDQGKGEGERLRERIGKK